MIRHAIFPKLIFVSLLFASAAFAQQPSNGPSVSVVGSPEVVVKSGGTATAKLTFRVNPGFHVNSNKPNSELLIPTTLKLSPPSEVMIANITYPAGEQITFPFSPDEKLSVYSGDFHVTALVRTAKGTPTGRFRVHGEIKFQACNDRQCFPPKSTPIEFDVAVQKSAAAGKHRRNPAQSPHIKG